MSWWGSHEVKEFKAHLLILEALKQAIDQLWWPRLPLIQLVLAKCNAVGWGHGHHCHFPLATCVAAILRDINHEDYTRGHLARVDQPTSSKQAKGHITDADYVLRCYQQETFCSPLRNVEMSERGPFGSWEKIQGCG